MSRWWILPAVVGIVPLRWLRRWWWTIPLLLVLREIIGAVLLGTVVPWLWSIVDSLRAARGI